MRILFMGTPEISRISLEALIDAGENIVGVITREDKPRGRGNVMTPTEVKRVALEKNIPVYTPKTLVGEEFISLLDKLMPELIVVVAYGKILPPDVINYPKLGCINLHVSLLPKYRGAAPMQRAIMEGESETGVTVMYMDEGLDTGDIIAAESFPISKTDNFETIHDLSATVGARLLVDTVDKIRRGTATRVKQDNAFATYAKKVEKTDAKIDFSLDAQKLDCIIRGVTPIPGAFAYLDGKMLKILREEPVNTNKSGKVGEVIETDAVGDGSVTVLCGKGAIKIYSVIPEGKGRMSAGDLVRGRKIKTGDILN